MSESISNKTVNRHTCIWPPLRPPLATNNSSNNSNGNSLLVAVVVVVIVVTLVMLIVIIVIIVIVIFIVMIIVITIIIAILLLLLILLVHQPLRKQLLRNQNLLNLRYMFNSDSLYLTITKSQTILQQYLASSSSPSSPRRALAAGRPRGIVFFCYFLVH